MIETFEVWAMGAIAVGVLIDAVHRAAAWPGMTANLGAVLLNGVYAASGAAVGIAPILSRDTWPGLLSVLLLSAAGLWAVTGRVRRAG
jgi:hypothetical protein